MSGKSIIIFITRQILIVVGLLALVEGAFRLQGYPCAETGIRHPIYHHDRIPNSHGRHAKPGEFSHEVQINSFGMRDRERSLKKSEGTYRVLVLGDSFTEGYGVDYKETFCYLAEKYLNRSGKGWPVEVMNAGRVSYSPVLEYLYYINFARRFVPDLTVLFLDWGDIQDDYLYEKLALKDASGTAVAVPGSADPRADKEYTWLEAKSALINYILVEQTSVYFRRYIAGKILRRIFGPEKYEEAIKKLREQKFPVEKGNMESDRYMIFREEQIKALQPHIERTQFYIRKLAETAREDGSRFLLVLYPYGIQVHPEEWAEGRLFFGFEKHRIYGEKIPFEIFERFAQDNEIPVLNLFSVFKASKDFPLYFSYDGHWNAKAHALVAEALGGRLADEIRASDELKLKRAVKTGGFSFSRLEKWPPQSIPN